MGPATIDAQVLECFIGDGHLVNIESQTENDCLLQYITEGG
jgi:hypothetical protein